MKTTFNLLFVLAALLASCTSGPSKVSELSFTDMVGQSDDAKGTLFHLTGTGFNESSRAAETEVIVNDWIKNHPEAEIIPVYAFGKGEVQMKFCLFVDGSDTLNNYMVRKGCYAADYMKAFKTWEEISSSDKMLIESLPGEQFVEFYLSDEEYNNFQNQIQAAERAAKNDKLGVWK